MHFLMAACHNRIRVSASIALFTVNAAVRTNSIHTGKQPYKYTSWLMSDGGQIQQQAAWEHLQNVYLRHLKQMKVIKRRRKKKVETKWILLSKM